MDSDGSCRRRAWSYGSQSVVSVLLFFGIIVFVALIGQRHPWRVDLTETGTYTLSEQTRKILDSLHEPVKITAFFAAGSPERQEAEDLLETYAYHTPKISYRFVDPDRDPGLARRYQVEDYGTLVLQGYGRKQTIMNADEESLTNAILKLTQKGQKRVYFLLGHGEHSIDDLNKQGYSSFKAALEKENYAVATLNLMHNKEVPRDAAVVVIAGPRKPLFAAEQRSLKRYLERGGRAMICLDPTFDGGLAGFVVSYGIELHNDDVIDKLSRVFGGSYLMPVVTQYGFHEITDGFDLATFYPEARSVRIAKKKPANVELTVLASTSENAWAETDLNKLAQGEASFDEGKDLAGPVPLMVLAQIRLAGSSEHHGPGSRSPSPKTDATSTEKRNGATGARNTVRKAYLLVCGDSDFADNTHFGLSGNGDLALNIIDYLAQEEALITIEGRKSKSRPLVLTRQQGEALFWIPLLLIPLLVLGAGLLVYRVRRKQR